MHAAPVEREPAPTDLLEASAAPASMRRRGTKERPLEVEGQEPQAQSANALAVGEARTPGPRRGCTDQLRPWPPRRPARAASAEPCAEFARDGAGRRSVGRRDRRDAAATADAAPSISPCLPAAYPVRRPGNTARARRTGSSGTQSARSSFARTVAAARSAAFSSRAASRAALLGVLQSLLRLCELCLGACACVRASFAFCTSARLGPDVCFRCFGAGAIPAYDENPTVSSSSVSAPRTSAARASSSATAVRRRSRTRRRIVSLEPFPRGATWATATSASSSSAVSSSAAGLPERRRVARDLRLSDLARGLRGAGGSLRAIPGRTVDGEDDHGRLAQARHRLGLVLPALRCGARGRCDLVRPRTDSARRPAASRLPGERAHDVNGAAPESNRPSRGLHDRTGFEDQLGHRAHAAPRAAYPDDRALLRSSRVLASESARRESRTSFAPRFRLRARS